MLADALGIEVQVAHRALADAETCARVLCAMFPRLCANAVTIADALALMAPAAQARHRAQAPNPGPDAAARSSTSPSCPSDPGVYLFRDDAGRALYVGKSVSIRSRARAHFAPSSVPADWTLHATIVDYRARTPSSARSCSRTG